MRSDRKRRKSRTSREVEVSALRHKERDGRLSLVIRRMVKRGSALGGRLTHHRAARAARRDRSGPQ
jgi:hypothetical protein